MLRLHWTAVNNLDIHKVLHKKDSDLSRLGVKPLLLLEGGLLGDGLFFVDLEILMNTNRI